jgi:hypothetical protein
VSHSGAQKLLRRFVPAHHLDVRVLLEQREGAGEVVGLDGFGDAAEPSVRGRRGVAELRDPERMLVAVREHDLAQLAVAGERPAVDAPAGVVRDVLGR